MSLATRSMAEDITTMKFTRLTADDGLCDNMVQHILQLPDNRMVFTTLGNMNIYDGSQFAHIHRSQHAAYRIENYRGAYHVYVDRQDRVWIKDYQRVVCYDLHGRTYVDNVGRLLCHEANVSGSVDDLFVDAEGCLWIVAEGKLWASGTRRGITLEKEWGELQDMECDKTMVYLFFNTGRVVGVSLETMAPAFESAAYDEPEQSRYAETSLIARGTDGMFYQLRNGSQGGFFSFNPTTRQWRKLLQTDYVLHTLMLDGEAAYIICQKGLWHIDLHGGKGILTEKLRLADGSTVDAAANTIFRDRQGGIWIGTYSDGLLYAHPRRFLFELRKDMALEWPADAGCLTDRRGWTWTATSDGVKLERRGEAEWLYSEDGLANDYVHSLVEDGDGHVWIATSNGISRAVVDGQGTLRLESFRISDGVQSGDYADGRAMRLSDGSIAMEGIGGVTLFHPRRTQLPDSMPLTPMLVEMKVNGRAYAASNAISLPYNENTLSFAFASMNYAFPQHTHFKYCLSSSNDTVTAIVGNDTGSSLVDGKGMLRLPFINMPPGTYTLDVRASLLPDLWKGGVCTVRFAILPPRWATWWAYTLYIISALAVVTGCVVAYLRHMKNETLYKLKEERLLARIESLIEHCNQLESERNVTPDVKEQELLCHSEADAEFLQKAIGLVECHLGQPYSVEQLSRDLCMERTGLYKRLSALLDKSPSLFMRSVRLRHAAQMIADGNMTLAEIAQRTGFSSASYLGKCFQEEYHCRPKEYAEKTRIST
ncbi:MAG: helix-turn-helix domain-containing protein [Bacteroides sp.]